MVAEEEHEAHEEHDGHKQKEKDMELSMSVWKLALKNTKGNREFTLLSWENTLKSLRNLKCKMLTMAVYDVIEN